MKLNLTMKTNIYEIGHNFYIDIVCDYEAQYYEAWIWNDRYGIKEHMISVPAEQQTYEEFLKIIEKISNEYIETYILNNFTPKERSEFYAKNNNLQS